MNKNELTLRMKMQSVKTLELWLGLGKHAISAIATVGAIGLIFKGLTPILQGMTADQLSATAKVFQALRPGSFLGYAWGMGATGLYMVERKGKKRLVRKKAELQKQLESGDMGRTSSNLSEDGSTPEAEDHDD